MTNETAVPRTRRLKIAGTSQILACLAVMHLFVFAALCPADTFTNRQTGDKLHGYVTGKAKTGQTLVQTKEANQVELDLGEWNVTPDRLGRNNKVIIIPVDEDIMTEIETVAYEKAIPAVSAQGPLFILLEIDTPGGRIDLAQRICAVITQKTDCETIAYIKGGQYGGAISAGAAVALACDKIYMADNTTIGGATLVAASKAKEDNKEVIYVGSAGEKHMSIWRAYLASLAEQNKRPGLLARAMVDNKIGVIEVNELGRRSFIEPVNKKTSQQVVRTWNKTGSLLTLTAGEAVQCTIADEVITSREQLLQKLDAGSADVVVDKSIQNARKELKRVVEQVLQIRKSLDLKVKQAKDPQPAPKVLAILRGAKSDFENLLRFAKEYPDLDLDVIAIENELNSVTADYEQILRESRTRR